jgi:CRAL/TRIO domain/CRAL/TRIO, N-terminal domain
MTASDSLRPSTEESTDSSKSKLSWKSKNRSEDSADSQAKLHNKKPPSSSGEDGGPRKTPFSSPEPEVTVPEPTPLTMEEETAYNSLLNAISEWCVLTTTRDGTTRSMPMVDEEYMWLSRECLLRYLRASKWNVATAQQRIIDTLQWRREYGITRVPASEPPKITADYISVENETGKQWILGFDNDGRPCHYLNPHLQNTERSDRQIEHLVFMLERVIELMPAGQESLALLMNFGETSRGQGASITQGKQVLHILQSHYPERLGKALLCNCTIFSPSPFPPTPLTRIQYPGTSGPS